MKSLIATLILLSLPVRASEPVRAPHAMVASVSEIASRAGADVMKKGGNAVDAAVTVALVLQVVWPEAGNIGGGGFMLVHTAAGSDEVIDYRERAPLAATREMYLDSSGNVIEGLSTVGGKAVGVPGTIAGLVLAHRKWGKLKWRDLLEPARKLAAEGFVVGEFLARSLNEPETLEKLAKFEESRRIYLPNGRPLQAGMTLVQPELAATLARLQKDPDDFYTGRTAKLLVEEVQARGGVITLKDLAGYQPTVRRPITGTYGQFRIVTMPPPSSGGVVLLEMLNMLEAVARPGEGRTPGPLGSLAPNSAPALNLLLEAMRRAFADRTKWLGDPDFVHVPVTGLANKRYAEERIKPFAWGAATSSAAIAAGDPAAYESPQTTHFTIIDPKGNVVSNTYTLNNSFGCGITVKGAGFLLNDEMDDFTSKPGVPNLYNLVQGEANAIAPRKRPLSSMTPTIVMKSGKVCFALGSPGGPTIINTVLQVILNVLDFHMNLQEAVDAPRFHHQWLPDEIYWEPEGLPEKLRQELSAMGYRFRPKAAKMGDAQAVMIDPKTGDRLGASDPRRGGKAVGW